MNVKRTVNMTEYWKTTESIKDYFVESFMENLLHDTIPVLLIDRPYLEAVGYKMVVALRNNMIAMKRLKHKAMTEKGKK